MIGSTKILIATIGEKGGGKDVVGKYLTNKYGALVMASGDLFRDILDLLGIEKERANITRLANTLRKEYSENIALDAMLKHFEKSDAKICVDNGMRKPEEVEKAKQLGFHFWYITAPIETRLSRIQNRNQNADDQTQTIEKFKEQEQLETEKYITELGLQCEVRIDNTGSIEELYKRVDEEISKLLH